MPLGSNPVTTISIDFVRAQGNTSEGRISFAPSRQALQEVMLSSRAVDVELDAGIGDIDLVRLPIGTYEVTERIDNRPPYVWQLTLPLNAPESLNYENLAETDELPAVYTTVKTVNGVEPDPITGDVEVAGGGGGAVDSVEGRIGVVDLSDLFVSPSDLSTGLSGKAALGHAHATADITGLTAATDARVAAGIATWIGAAPGALDTLIELAAALGNDPNFAATMATALGGKASTGSVTAVENRVTSLEAVGYRVANTGLITTTFTASSGGSGAWTVCPAAFRVAVAAVAGDVLRWNPSVMANPGDGGYEFDLAAINGSAAPVRYASSRTGVQAANGYGGLYMGGAYSRVLRGVPWTVQAGDIFGGTVTLALMYRAGSGMTIGSALYPSEIELINRGAPKA